MQEHGRRRDVHPGLNQTGRRAFSSSARKGLPNARRSRARPAHDLSDERSGGGAAPRQISPGSRLLSGELARVLAGTDTRRSTFDITTSLSSSRVSDRQRYSNRSSISLAVRWYSSELRCRRARHLPVVLDTHGRLRQGVRRWRPTEEGCASRQAHQSVVERHGRRIIAHI